MKTKIKLHGRLAKIFGNSFEFFNIKKPIDAVNAINTIHKNFKETIIADCKEGQNYELLVNKKSVNALSLQHKQKIEEIEIVPCIIGHGIGAVIAGGLSVAAGLGAFGAMGAFASAFFVSLGVGLIMAGVVYLLTPIPENEPREIEATVKTESFLFQSQNNVASQGSPVRLGYGRLRVGSQVIASSVRNKDIESEENPFLEEDDILPFSAEAIARMLTMPK
jgi:predicted phage tail protein